MKYNYLCNLEPMFIQEEALVLKSAPFEEKTFIVDLFCENTGIVKVFVRGVQPGLEPYTHISVVLQKGRKDLYYLKEFSLLARLPKERTPPILEVSYRLYEALEGATRDAQIYALYKAFLENLHLAKKPRNILASFLLKLLRHEGLLSIDRAAGATIFAEGEWFTEKEAPVWGLHLSEKEVEDLLIITTSRSLWEIDEKNLSEAFLMKINQIFENAKGGT